MKPTLCVVIGLAGGLLTAALWLSERAAGVSARQGVPLLRVDALSRRLSPADPDSRVATIFELHNDGLAPLRIGEPQKSCGCSDVILSSSQILPGKTAELRVQVIVPPVGTQSIDIKLPTNSVLTPIVHLRVIAESNAPPPYVMEAKSGLNFTGWLQAGERHSAFVRTWERANTMPWLKDFRADLDFVSARLTSVEAPGAQPEGYVQRTYHLEVSLTGAPRESHHGKLNAFAAGAEQPVATIPISIEPSRAVEVYPRALYLTGAGPQEGSQLLVRAVQPGFRLEAAVQGPLPDWLEIEPVDRFHDAVQAFRVRVRRPAEEQGSSSLNKPPSSETDSTIDPPMPLASSDGLRRGAITLATNHPEMKTFVVPIYYCP